VDFHVGGGDKLMDLSEFFKIWLVWDEIEIDWVGLVGVEKME